MTACAQRKGIGITMKKKADILIIGSGAAGLFCALQLPRDKKIVIISKDDAKHSDSFLAQGGICVLKSEDDYDSYFEDTMRAGHYENRKESVDIMIRSSRRIIDDLILYGVDFENDHGSLIFTREGGHSTPRILFHEDATGREITGCLLRAVRALGNVSLYEHRTMIDLVTENNTCFGAVVTDDSGTVSSIRADYTVLACGGLGGLYEHTTNFKHMTGDALAIALKHGIEVENMDYIQIHPTTLYSQKPGRRFLISESVRGEGAVLLNKAGDRFVDELLPRDVLTQKVYEQMRKDDMPYVRLSLEPIPEEEITGHFPNIYQRCLEEGYDVTKEPIPVVPAQHYFMGGIWVDSDSRTSMRQLYAVGETSCNGVHGANRLASNSLLESLVFAKRAAHNIADHYVHISREPHIAVEQYADPDGLREEYKRIVLEEVGRAKDKRKKTERTKRE